MLCGRQALGTSPYIHVTKSRAHAFVPRALKQADTKPSTKDVKRSTATAWGKKKVAVPADPEEPQQEGWGLLDLQAYNRKWDVPWGPITTIAGLGAWALSFAAVGFYVVPKLYLLSNLDLRNATATDKATYTLVIQTLQTVAGIGVIRFFADRYRSPTPADPSSGSAAAGNGVSPSEKADDELFNYSPLQPFRSPNGWLFWAIIGMVAAPFVVGTLAYTLTAIGYDKAYSETRGTVDGIVPIISAGPATYLSLLAVTGGLAPLLEETVFRGFLLTSLTKYFPTWVAVLGSSLCFGAAHFSARDFPVLTGLGVLLGFSYVRSRNLLTPMLIHGAWNSTVLSVLFYLSSSGIDVTQLLRDVKDVQ
jgi:uncharacterized protein